MGLRSLDNYLTTLEPSGPFEVDRVEQDVTVDYYHWLNSLEDLISCDWRARTKGDNEKTEKINTQIIQGCCST